MTRFDHQFSDSDSIFVRYTLDDSSTDVVEQLPGLEGGPDQQEPICWDRL